MKIRYVVVSPVRDEGEHLAKTAESIIGQTIRPATWIIVNDGSTDGTAEIIDRYASRYPWIHAVHRENRGFRKSGGGVMEAFYDGYGRLESTDWDYLVKLDGDLSFSNDYFERCFLEFEKDSRLGIGGGGIYHIVDGKMVLEKTPLFHVRGATKIYRKACWKDIDGLIKAPGWDTLDEVKANMKGWKTHSFEELSVIHHRFTGEADGGWRNAVKNGLGGYISGYHPLFMLLKCAKWIFHKPYLISGLGLIYGYLYGYITNAKIIQDEELVKYIRKEQMKKLLFMKSIWK